MRPPQRVTAVFSQVQRNFGSGNKLPETLMRVEMANHGRTEGEKLDIVGTMSSTSAGVRRIVATSFIVYP